MLEIGAEAARKRLPELLDRAHTGEQTIEKSRHSVRCNSRTRSYVLLQKKGYSR